MKGLLSLSSAGRALERARIAVSRVCDHALTSQEKEARTGRQVAHHSYMLLSTSEYRRHCHDTSDASDQKVVCI